MPGAKSAGLGIHHQRDFTVVFFLYGDVQVANSALRKIRQNAGEKAEHSAAL